MQKELCFITYQFKTGGVEKLFTTYANEHKRNIHLLIINPNWDEFKSKIPNNVKIIPSPYSTLKIKNRIIHYIIYIFYLTYIVNTKKEFKKIVFINFSDTLSTLFATWFLSLGRKYRYSWIQLNPRVIKNSKFYKLYSFLYSRMDKIICICKMQQNIFLELFPNINKQKTDVINNCINPNDINRLKKEQLPLPYRNYKYILMVARLDMRSKDFYTMIDAYNLGTIKNECKLLILGEGPNREDLEAYIKKNRLNQYVILLGQDSNPYKWMHNAHIYIHSSKAEGFGLVIIEAMQCETPIIATDCEVGPKEILDNNKYGILVPVGDHKAMNIAIHEMISNIDKINYYKQKSIERAKHYYVNKSIEKIYKL